VKKVYPKPRAVAKPSGEDFLTTLEVMCREKIGEVLQAVLEAEVDEFFVRVHAKKDRTRSGHRDGHENARTVTYGSHPIELRRPRVRGSAERFDPKVLPPYRRRFENVDKTLHEFGSKACRRETSSHLCAPCSVKRRRSHPRRFLA